MPAIQSMTAFARREAVFSWGSLTWEIRSVNHRYLEVQSRVPDALRHLESTCRELLRERLGRGKIDCTLRLQVEENTDKRFNLNQSVIRALHDAWFDLERMTGGLAPPNAMDILRWPGVIGESSLDAELLAKEAMNLLGDTLDELIGMRAREGAKLAELLQHRLQDIETILAQLRADTSRIVAELRQRLRDRVAELQIELVADRLEQEVALLAAKSDVAEEVDRLQTHVAETRRSLRQGGACGRRLDFLMQEFNREANTLSSKSVSADTTRRAVDLKVLIEQMREQVQNIE